MVKGYSPLEGSQEDIDRRLLRKIAALEHAISKETARVKALEDALGEYESESTIAERLDALETPANP